MKKKYLLLLLLTVAMSVNTLFAKEVTQAVAESIAKQFHQAVFSTTRGDVSVVCDLVYTGESSVITRIGANSVPFYVFNYTDGFVIVSGDDVTSPILGYSTTGKFIAENMPANLAAWMMQYQNSIEATRKSFTYLSKVAHPAWDNISTIASTTRTTSEKLLTTASWGQDSPYNDLCPTIGSEKTVTGCVATALSIIMKYHTWPTVGTGETFSYDWNGQTLTSTFNTTYDWVNMPNEYTSGGYTADQATAVAKLMYDAGIISQMDYGVDLSSAYSYDAVMGMINYMKYDKGAFLLSKEWFSAKEWMGMLKSEIDNNRPILYSGESESDGGHLFILDGYNNEFFHVNWGWEGYCNGYYLIEKMNPEALDGEGFANGQNAIFGLKPITDNSAYNDVLILSTAVGDEERKGLTTSTTTFVQGVPFSLTIGYVFNYSMRIYNGILKLVHCDKDGAVKDELLGIDFLDKMQRYGGRYTRDVTINQPIAAGDYICLMHRSNDSDTDALIYSVGDVTSKLLIGTATSIQNAMVADNVSVEKDGDNLVVQSEDGIESITIYSTSGVLIDQINCSSRLQVVIGVGYLSKDTYLLKVVTKSGESNQKFVR